MRPFGPGGPKQGFACLHPRAGPDHCFVMGDWQELAQSAFKGLIFSYLVAKLISMVISIRDVNLKVVRQEDLPSEPIEQRFEVLSKISESETELVNESSSHEKSRVTEEEEEDDDAGRGFSEKQNSFVEHFSDEDDDDDWEGIESTELDEIFSAATAFVATAAADRLSQKVSNDIQLQLYGLYKIATEGPCTTPQPSALKMTARAKWNAWQKLGSMPPEEAMEKYIDIVCELYPSWAAGSSVKRKDGDGDASSGGKGTMGPVFSSFAYEEESENEMKMDAIHDSAREGERDNLLKYIESGVPVNLKDSEGRSPLHWAVDRGHLDIVELLLSKSADVNAQDNEGQTPLHYAAMCDREKIAEVLVTKNADTGVKDDDGNSPWDLCESNWHLKQQS